MTMANNETMLQSMQKIIAKNMIDLPTYRDVGRYVESDFVNMPRSPDCIYANF